MIVVFKLLLALVLLGGCVTTGNKNMAVSDAWAECTDEAVKQIDELEAAYMEYIEIIEKELERAREIEDILNSSQPFEFKVDGTESWQK